MSDEQTRDDAAEKALMKEVFRERSKKAQETLRNSMGEEAYREHMARIGAKGGKAYVDKGFSITGKHLDRFVEVENE